MPLAPCQPHPLPPVTNGQAYNQSPSHIDQATTNDTPRTPSRGEHDVPSIVVWA